VASHVPPPHEAPRLFTSSAPHPLPRLRFRATDKLTRAPDSRPHRSSVQCRPRPQPPPPNDCAKPQACGRRLTLLDAPHKKPPHPPNPVPIRSCTPCLPNSKPPLRNLCKSVKSVGNLPLASYTKK